VYLVAPTPLGLTLHYTRPFPPLSTTLRRNNLQLAQQGSGIGDEGGRGGGRGQRQKAHGSVPDTPALMPLDAVGGPATQAGHTGPGMNAAADGAATA